MKLTNRQVIDSAIALGVLSGVQLPVKPSYHISRALRKIKLALTDYDKVRVSLVNKHAKKDADGVPVPAASVDELESPKEFTAEHDELLDIEAEVDVSTVSIASFGDAKIMPSTLAPLDWMLTE